MHAVYESKNGPIELMSYSLNLWISKMLQVGNERKNEAPGLPPEVPHELLGWEGVPGEIK